MKLFIISGEASGDLHGSNLAKELIALNPAIQLRGWGGERMQYEGVEILKHYKDLAFMGFVEVVMNLRTIRKNFKQVKREIIDFAPDALILIDYPGFNLRIAEWASKRNIKVLYYISPQVWAWKENRVKGIKKHVDEMLVILPFEKPFYKKHGLDVNFVGHPLLDELDKLKPIAKSNVRSVALLPGSRKQEIKKMLPLMMTAVQHFKEVKFVVAMAPSIEKSFYESIVPNQSYVRFIAGKTYDILRSADAALVTSGTATLEAALLRIPLVVCYKGSALSFWIAKRLVSIKYISLVNLIMDREVVPELIQSDLNEARLVTELEKALHDLSYREQLEKDFTALREICGGQGASKRAAQIMLKSLAGIG